MAQTRSPSTILALDIGEKRIGVAIASMDAGLPAPLVTLANDEDLMTKLDDLIDEHEIDTLVIGLPRGLDGQDTAQTKQVRTIAGSIQSSLGLDVSFQDEALTSVKAEEELSSRGKIYEKGDVDKLAATYILQDYINDNFN